MKQKRRPLPEKEQDPSALLHELKIHQAELEAQNEELLETQKALAHARDEYRELYELAPVGYLTVTPGGTIKNANAMALEVLQTDQEKLLGKNFFHLFLWSDRDVLFRHFQDVLSASNLRTCDLRLNAGNPLADIRLISIARHRRDDELFLVVSDLTEQRELRRRVRDSERLNALGAASATLAHEIGNPLNAMYSTLQKIERDVSKDMIGPGEVLAYLQAMRIEVDRLRTIVNDIRELARPPRLHRSRLLLKDVIQNCLLAARLNEKHIELRRQLDSRFHIQGDNAKLTQAILNLIENAMDAMPDGGTLSLRTYDAKSSVCLDVENTGKAVPRDIDIFEPFVTSKEQGFGLGLALVKQIISSHGGSISYHSLSKGTTFHISLPALETNH